MEESFLSEDEEGELADETVTLSELVEGREARLSEEELWALCRECCLTLEYVHSTQELFQSLVITPDTVAFDREGSVCFLDLDKDPEPLYISPDAAHEGNTYKSHLYSLGMTLLYAVEYMGHSVDTDLQSVLSEDLHILLSQLTYDDPGKRPDLETVLKLCDLALQDGSSQEICQRLACSSTEQCLKDDNSATLLSVTEELASYLQNQTGLVTPGQGGFSDNCDSGQDQLSSSDSNTKSSSYLLHGSADRWMELETNKEGEKLKDEGRVNSVAAHTLDTVENEGRNLVGSDGGITSRKRRRQGLLLSEILTYLERKLQEAELWALCKESIVSLQRKKKHMPAYISPDTVMLNANGCISYKAIPEDKPLEVIFMAPELQQKGIVSEKTCLYGLGVTLRSAAGEKYVTSSPNSTAGQALQELLSSLLHPNPEYRPSLEVGLLACDEYEKQTSVDFRCLCQKLYMDASTFKDTGAKDFDHKETRFSEGDMEERELLSASQPSAFKPVSRDVQSASAFRPVGIKQLQHLPKTEHPEQQRIPSAFSSPATHFKPIVLHNSSVSAMAGESQISAHVEEEERDKTLLTKLKELKRNIQKSGQTTCLSDGVVSDDTKPAESSDSSIQMPVALCTTQGSQRSEQSEQTSEILEAVLRQFKSSGHVLDTQSLALAIADHLQRQLSGGEAGWRVSSGSSKTSLGDGQTSVEISAGQISLPVQILPQQLQQQGQPLPAYQVPLLIPQQQEPVPASHQQVAGVVSNVNGLVSNMNVGFSPANQTQGGFLGQPVPVSFVQYPGSLIAGAPVQFCMQQDPRTGLVQFVPVGIMSYSPHSQPTTPSSTHTPQSEASLPQPSPCCNASPSAAFLASASSKDSSGTASGEAHADQSSHKASRSVSMNSHSTKGLLQKTAAKQAKLSASTSASNSPEFYSHTTGEHSHPVKPVSESDIQNPKSNDTDEFWAGFDKRSSIPGSCLLSRNSDCDSDPRSGQGASGQLTCHHKEPVLSSCVSDCVKGGLLHHNQSHSQPLSPLPSKNGTVSFPANSLSVCASEGGPVEGQCHGKRLQNSPAQTQVRQILQEWVGVVNITQDKEMISDYILSLAHLKWETFKSAVTEKYSYISWPHIQLASLFQAVNGNQGPSDRDAAKAQLEKLSKAFISKEQDLTGDETKLHSGLMSNSLHLAEQKTSAQAAKNEVQVRTNSVNFGNSQENIVGVSGVRTEGLSKSLVHVLPSGRYSSRPSETSDSTDNEEQDLQIHVKKRLDHRKSCSPHSLQGSTCPSTPAALVPFTDVLGTSIADTDTLSITGVSSCQSRPLCGQHEVLEELGGASPNGDVFSADLHGSTSYVPSSYHSIPRRQHSPHAKVMHFYSTEDWKTSKSLQVSERMSQSVRRGSVSRPVYEPGSFANGVSLEGLRVQRPEHGDAFQQSARDPQREVLSSRTNSILNSSYSSSSTGQIKKSEVIRMGNNRVLMQGSRQTQGHQEMNNNSPFPGKPGVPDVVRPSAQQFNSGGFVCKVPQTHHVPRLAWGRELGEYHKKGQVVYHWAIINLNRTEEVARFIHSIQEKEKKLSIEARLASLEQELTMQRKQLRKSQGFYRKLTVPGLKHSKGDGKAVVSQVLRDMSEMIKKLRFLELCRTHLQVLLGELYGLDICFLHTLVASGGGAEGDPPALVLQPYLENHLLQFQTIREPATGYEMQMLQAGHPKGLLAFLFTRSALSDGFIHQFLFCFRYFLRTEEVFDFIVQKYLAAAKGNQKDVNMVRVQQRALDLLHYWLEGYYSVDFERNESLQDQLENFVAQQVENSVEGAQNLLNLLYACHLGENMELAGPLDSVDYQDEVYYIHLASPKKQTKAEQLMEWESFSALLGRKKANKTAQVKGSGIPFKEDGRVMVEKRPVSRSEDGSMLPSRRRDAMQLMDYPAHRLAEQLTLMEQELFQRTHPVHYLDSKARGVGVDLSIPTLMTPSVSRKATGGGHSSLFVGAQHFESKVGDMIAHAKEITHWVSAEVLGCGSQKGQETVLLKLLKTAHLCTEIHNFATALAIFAGLDNLLVRQLSAWKGLPAKSATIMEELEQLQVKMKSDSMAIMNEKDSHTYPTIPCILYFLLHLQQLEIGGFKLANGMYKWSKMRSICQFVDQIRIFREHEYGFEPDYELQSLIRRHLHELSSKDLQTIAVTYTDSFRRQMSTAAGLHGTFRRVLAKLQPKSK